MANCTFQTKAKVIKNIEVAQRYYKILLSCAPIARLAKPGQFVEVKISENYEPFLRRPFSIHRVKSKRIEILYEVLGKGTGVLSQKKPGEYLDIIGPLGNGFSLNRLTGTSANRQTIIVAGGMGVAPLVFLVEKLTECKMQNSKRKTVVLIGARTKKEILCSEEFKALGCEVKVSTDDGSRGFKGKTTDLLRNLPSTIDHRPSTIYACGPKPMLKEIARISKKYNIPAQISLEEHMACGIGACLGCVVETKDGYKRVCKEGPVFEAGQIIWRKE